MSDPVHMLVGIPPKISVSSFMGYLKGKSVLMMFDRHTNLKSKFGNRHFWSEGYYVSTVGLNEATIKEYIQDQEKADIYRYVFKSNLCGMRLILNPRKVVSGAYELWMPSENVLNQGTSFLFPTDQTTLTIPSAAG